MNIIGKNSSTLSPLSCPFFTIVARLFIHGPTSVTEFYLALYVHFNFLVTLLLRCMIKRKFLGYVKGTG